MAVDRGWAKVNVSALACPVYTGPGQRVSYSLRGAGVLVFLFLAALGATAQNLPPLSVEISAEHPLFIFQDLGAAGVFPAQYAQHVSEVWGQLPNALKPYSAMQVDAPQGATRPEYYAELMKQLQGAGVPLVARIADEDPLRRYPAARLEDLLRAFTAIRGVEVASMPFDEYDPAKLDEQGVPLDARWLMDVIDVAARYGRFVHIPLGKLQWPRFMSNPAYAPLYQKIFVCRNYVIPSCLERGPHTIPSTSALMGLWLEGAVTNWGIASDSRWYADARYVEPGTFGVSAAPDKTPVTLYRAMILTGAMTGAAVYSFTPDADLWFGANRRYWDEAILPTLLDLVAKGFIARKDFVTKKAQAACRLIPASNPNEFHANLHDIDGVLDKGFLMHAIYGMEKPGQVAELIPNQAQHFWMPILSVHAQRDFLDTFAAVIPAGVKTAAEEWTTQLKPFEHADGTGTAFIAAVGRAVFILNSRENLPEAQTFSLPAVPAPVRKIVARRESGSVELSWPFREGDVSYNVYKRVAPETHATMIAEGLLERRFVDASVTSDQNVAYAVTALTNETEPYEGVVNYGQYVVLSTVEGRVAEEVVLSPLLSTAESTPIINPPGPENVQNWWPRLDGLDDAQTAAGKAIAERIETWEKAFESKSLTGVMDLYAAEYQDPQGWHEEYVRRAYQWFFERCPAPHMARQARAWDFSELASMGRAKVLLYISLTGAAISDPSGRIADQAITLPRTAPSEVWITFVNQGGIWRIAATDPALPNFRDLLSYSAGPYDGILPGPDK